MAATPTTTTEPGPDIPLTDRMKRALYEPALCMPNTGQARNAPGLVEVVTTGEPHLVDLRLGVCDCRDFQYRAGPCKHLHRARFASGRVPIPASADQGLIDTKLGVLFDK